MSLKAGERYIFVLSCKVNSSVFTDVDSDYWCFRKYYLGKETYNLEVAFSPSRKPKNAFVEKVIDSDYQNPIFIKNVEVKHEPKKSTIPFSYILRKTNEEIYLRWIW